jgi:hypothetical protein
MATGIQKYSWNLIGGLLMAGALSLQVTSVQAEPATDLQCNGCVNAGDIAGAAVKTSKIRNHAVTKNKLRANAVDSFKIRDGQVKTPDLADGAVTGSKIKANAVNSFKIRDGQVKTPDLADGAVTGSKIADGAITPEKLALGDQFEYVLFGCRDHEVFGQWLVMWDPLDESNRGLPCVDRMNDLGLLGYVLTNIGLGDNLGWVHYMERAGGTTQNAEYLIFGCNSSFAIPQPEFFVSWNPDGPTGDHCDVFINDLGALGFRFIRDNGSNDIGVLQYLERRS